MPNLTPKGRLRSLRPMEGAVKSTTPNHPDATSAPAGRALRGPDPVAGAVRRHGQPGRSRWHSIDCARCALEEAQS